MEKATMSRKEVIAEIEAFNNAAYTKTTKSSGGADKIHFIASKFAKGRIESMIYPEEVYNSKERSGEYFIFHCPDIVFFKVQEMYGWEAIDVMSELATCGFSNEEIGRAVNMMIFNESFKIK